MQKHSPSSTNRPRGRPGARAFWLSRATAVALLVLVPVVLAIVVGLAGRDYATVRQTLAHPLVALAIGLLVLIGVAHMRLGMAEIIEDYVHAPGTLRLLSGLNWLFALAMLALSLWAVARLVLGI